MKKKTPHVHAFKFKKLKDGSVRRSCSCGETVVEVASGKFSHTIDKGYFLGRRKNPAAAAAIALLLFFSSCASTVNINGYKVHERSSMKVSDRNLFHYSFVVGFAGTTQFKKK